MQVCQSVPDDNTRAAFAINLPKAHIFILMQQRNIFELFYAGAISTKNKHRKMHIFIRLVNIKLIKLDNIS